MLPVTNVFTRLVVPALATRASRRPENMKIKPSSYLQHSATVKY